MSDNPNDKPQGGANVQSQGDNNGASQGDGKTITLVDALAKIDALEKDNAGYRRKQRENETATKTAEEARLTEQQKWQELAESRRVELDKLKPVAEQHETITAAFNASLDNRLKQIPEDIRKKTVDPIRAALPPVEFSNWLDANLDILRSRQAPNLDGGAGGGGGNLTAVTLTAEQRQLAEWSGMTPDQYAKSLQAVEKQRGSAPNI